MKLLCISNGHGEDAIALRILKPLSHICSPTSPTSPMPIQLAVLPLSGTGSAYRTAGLLTELTIIGPTQALPSGGFLNRDPKQLARDVRQGLVSLTRAQLAAIKAWAATGDVILAVGDIVPLLFAYLSGLPYVFVGTAKSEYWLRDERGKLPATQSFPASLWEKLKGWSGSVYLPWERWLMSRDRCLAVFVRDALTAKQLQGLGIATDCIGNPMMDGLAPTGKLANVLQPLRASSGAAGDQRPDQRPSQRPDQRLDQRLDQRSDQTSPLNRASKSNVASSFANATALYVTPKQQPEAPLTIALIPGSRQPEAYENWKNLLTAMPGLTQSFPYRPLILLGAIAPSLSLEKLQSYLADWHPSAASTPYPMFTRQNTTLMMITDAYSDCLHEAEIAIATAGTATEQFVGLGKPAITLPGKGPQFTLAFATVQAKMLGPSVQMVTDSATIGPAIAKIMSDPDRLQLVYQNGKRRMGESGAGSAIATQLDKILKSL